MVGLQIPLSDASGLQIRSNGRGRKPSPLAPWLRRLFILRSLWSTWRYPTPYPLPSKGRGKAAENLPNSYCSRPPKREDGRERSPMQRGAWANACWSVARCSVEREPTQRGALADATWSVKPPSAEGAFSPCSATSSAPFCRRRCRGPAARIRYWSRGRSGRSCGRRGMMYRSVLQRL